MNKVIQNLLKNPENFDFFQAVSLLEKYLSLENLNMKIRENHDTNFNDFYYFLKNIYS